MKLREIYILEDDYSGLEDADEFGTECAYPGCVISHGEWSCENCGRPYCDDHIVPVEPELLKDNKLLGHLYSPPKMWHGARLVQNDLDICPDCLERAGFDLEQF